MNIFDYEIIDWRKIDVYTFWGGLFFTICHPIHAWKYDRNCYGSFLHRCGVFFRDTIPSYTPFSKACRWLTHKLVHNIVDTKYLDKFYCRKRGDYTTYYCGKAIFGHFSLYEIYYKRCGNGYAKKPKRTKLTSGWVFSKKSAIKIYQKNVEKYYKLYHSEYQTHPEIAHPEYMYIVENINSILQTGKPTTAIYFDSIYYKSRYNDSKDRVEKLWCYVSHLLSCPNDFMAHEQLARIFNICDNYLYYKEMKKNPEVDFTYNQTLAKIGPEEAKKWQLQMIKDNNYAKTCYRLDKEINELEEFYKNQSFDYYRV